MSAAFRASSAAASTFVALACIFSLSICICTFCFINSIAFRSSSAAFNGASSAAFNGASSAAFNGAACLASSSSLICFICSESNIKNLF